MSEQRLRAVLAEIDGLRRRAEAAERMHTRWAGFGGDFVEERTVTVRRRWWDGTPHSEYVMQRDEVDLFLAFIKQRAGALRAQADALAATLGTEGERPVSESYLRIAIRPGDLSSFSKENEEVVDEDS